MPPLFPSRVVPHLRSRLAKGGLEVLEEQSKALDLEGEIEALELKAKVRGRRFRLGDVLRA